MRCAAKIEIGGVDTRRQGSVALGGLASSMRLSQRSTTA